MKVVIFFFFPETGFLCSFKGVRRHHRLAESIHLTLEFLSSAVKSLHTRSDATCLEISQGRKDKTNSNSKRIPCGSRI